MSTGRETDAAIRAMETHEIEALMTNNRDERTPDMTEERGAVALFKRDDEDPKTYAAMVRLAKRENAALLRAEQAEARATSAEADAASWKADAASEFLKRQEAEAALKEAVGLLKRFLELLPPRIAVFLRVETREFLARQEGEREA